MDASVAALEAKVATCRPEAVALVGKGVWESVARVKKGRALGKGEFGYGWQQDEVRMGAGEGWAGARVFVATTTSGLAAGMSVAEKEGVWRGLGEWVGRRRGERVGRGEGGENGVGKRGSRAEN